MIYQRSEFCIECVSWLLVRPTNISIYEKRRDTTSAQSEYKSRQKKLVIQEVRKSAPEQTQVAYDHTNISSSRFWIDLTSPGTPRYYGGNKKFQGRQHAFFDDV